jgi:hypothetical protein
MGRQMSTKVDLVQAGAQSALLRWLIRTVKPCTWNYLGAPRGRTRHDELQTSEMPTLNLPEGDQVIIALNVIFSSLFMNVV